ncbi:MAG: ATP-binding protein [Armatimonadetes bacterium]|nr:ATP-binding protein [Armatimonadota bacterium]
MLRDLFVRSARTDLVELIMPKRSFADVVLPQSTRDQLYAALMQIDKHRLIFHQWGLGERHPQGTGLAFNFAGPPGTGKTICAEAVARALGKKLCRVAYSEVESCWAGETGKNIRAVFREARANDAVLFFDEADSIAARRFASLSYGYEREANQAVNILLAELENYDGVVIFATNMACNFDPAFERRIRTHILFDLPGEAERERIWKVQLHPEKTPLGPDVDFKALARQFAVPGGDIKNAVLKAAQLAAAEDGPDGDKRLYQRHFVAAMEQVLAAKVVMQQNLLASEGAGPRWEMAAGAIAARLHGLEEDLDLCREELGALSRRAGERDEAWRAEFGHLSERYGQLEAAVAAGKSALAELAENLRAWQEAEEERWCTRFQRQWDAILSRRTLLPVPPWATLAISSLLALGIALAAYTIR